jgi:homoserine dehydrogenase
MPTASAVVADMIDTAVGRTKLTFETLELWSNRQSRYSMRDFSKLPSRYYLRFAVEDRPGVLAQIAGVLGNHHISIASVIQHGSALNGATDTVPLVIMTHAATEGDAAVATQEIDRLPCIHGGSVRMRVLDD